MFHAPEPLENRTNGVSLPGYAPLASLPGTTFRGDAEQESTQHPEPLVRCFMRDLAEAVRDRKDRKF